MDIRMGEWIDRWISGWMDGREDRICDYDQIEDWRP